MPFRCFSFLISDYAAIDTLRCCRHAFMLFHFSQHITHYAIIAMLPLMLLLILRFDIFASLSYTTPTRIHNNTRHDTMSPWPLMLLR